MGSSIIAGLFPLRYWKSTRDRFFLFFALSFGLEGVNRILLGLLGGLCEDTPACYSIRLMAYSLILIAILDKNRLGPRGNRRQEHPAQRNARGPGSRGEGRCR